MPTDGQYAKESSWPEVERDHAAVITYLDAYVGELMALLDTTHQSNNTLVIFASDNGAHLEGGHDYLFFNSTGGWCRPVWMVTDACWLRVLLVCCHE